MTIRDELWDVAVDKNGFFTLDDARDLGLDEVAVRMMVTRNRVERVARGVFRFPQLPATEADPYMLAVLWTGAHEAALSHETALAVRGYGDINPGKVHVTVRRGRRIRRVPTGPYVVHHEDLRPAQIGWWKGVPTVTVATAVRQCLKSGTPGYLLRQAILEAHRDGALPGAEAEELRSLLDGRLAHA